MSVVGVGYTLATGRLFCDFSEFHRFAERLAGRPILTHEFADPRIWDELRQRFEAEATEANVTDPGQPEP